MQHFQARQRHGLLASMTNRQCSRWRITAQPTWKKSVESIVAARVCKNVRHVVSVPRCGAEEMRFRLVVEPALQLVPGGPIRFP